MLETHCADIIIRNALDLTIRLEEVGINATYSFASADISTMYTNIDLNEIAEALDFILEYDLQLPNKATNHHYVLSYTCA